MELIGWGMSEDAGLEEWRSTTTSWPWNAKESRKLEILRVQID